MFAFSSRVKEVGSHCVGGNGRRFSGGQNSKGKRNRGVINRFLKRFNQMKSNRPGKRLQFGLMQAAVDFG